MPAFGEDYGGDGDDDQDDTGGGAEDIGPEEAVGEGHPADSAGEHTDEGEADGTEAHDVDGQGEGRHVLDGCLAHADDVGTVGYYGERGPENAGGDIAVLEPDVASCQEAGSDQGEDDGAGLSRAHSADFPLINSNTK